MKVGVARETAAGERRVALVPETLGKLTAAGLEVLVEAGAGAGSSIPDSSYVEAGATIVPTAELYAAADVVLRVQKPSPAEVALLRQGQAVIGLLAPLIDPALAAEPRGEGGHGDQPRRPAADALARPDDGRPELAGERRRVQGRPHRGERVRPLFPAPDHRRGHGRPANVLILGIGVAGLQAIGTARRLGAVVKAYDVRSETKEQAESLGATFIVLKSVAEGAGEGGYARQLSPEEQAAQQAELNGHIATMDVIITTAQVPGRRPPLLVTAEAVRGMKPGSVIVDMAASALGGNVELSMTGETVVSDNGVTIIAPDNLPATMPAGASAFYARNISALLLHFVKDGAMTYDFDEEITAGTVITHGGQVVQAATRKLLEPAAPAAGGAA